MALKMMKVGLTPALVAAVALLAGATEAYAQRKITRLGNPATRLTAPIRDTAALQRTFTNKRNQTNVSRVLDKAGLTSITPQVISALTEGTVTETSVAPGTPIQWMGLRRAGRADIITDAVWAGTKPFDAYQFMIDDGDKGYTFVVPKACGNLSLLSVGPSPKKLAEEAARRAEEEKRRAAEAAAAAEAKRRAEEEARKEAERKAFEALPPSCGVTAIATKVKGGFDIAIDGTGSTTGRKPAEAMMVQIVGPLGQPVAATYEGTEQTELSMKTPFQGTAFVRRPKPGTYTIRATTMTGQARNTCEATAVVPEYDNIDWFVDGAFGKQRRTYEFDNPRGNPPTLSAGFCDPMLGFKVGPLFWFADQRASFAPAAGMAFMFGDFDDDINADFGGNEYNNASFILEAVVNYHFTERGAYIGTGIGWWDVFDGDYSAGAWIVNFGAPFWSNAKDDQMFVIGEGRLFFEDGGVDNNYQLWGGLRYVWR